MNRLAAARLVVFLSGAARLDEGGATILPHPALVYNHVLLLKNKVRPYMERPGRKGE